MKFTFNTNKFLLITFFVFYLNTNLSAQLNFDWARNYGGSGWDESTCILQTSSNDIYISGSMRLEEENMWLLKIDPEKGNPKWGKTFSGFYISRAQEMIETSDKHIVLAGYTVPYDSVTKNFWIIKIDTLGNTIWQKNYGDEYNNEAWSIIQTSDGGFVAVGGTTSSINFSMDWWILKLNSTGEILWKKQFGGSNEDYAKDVTELQDGSVVVTGYVGMGNSYRKISVVRLGTDGEEIWYKSYYINNWEEATSITTTHDNFLVLSGFTRQEAITDYDALVMKLNTDGDTLWMRIFGRDYFKNLPSNEIGYQKKIISEYNKKYWDEASAVVESFDDDYIIGGFSKANEMMKSDFMIVKYSPDGDLVWYDFFNRESLDICTGMIETREKNIMLSGVTYSIGNAWDYAVLKYASGEKSTIRITNPVDSVLAVVTDTVKVSLCIHCYRKPINLYVINNSKIVSQFSDFPEKDEEAECPFTFDLILNLELGKNEIELKAVDERDFNFSEFRTIYYIPSLSKVW